MVLRNFLLISVALAVSATTAIFTKNWLATERAGIAAQVELEAAVPATSTGLVLVAKREAPAGTFLKPEDLEWVTWPEDGVVDAFIQEGDLTIEDLGGAVVRMDVHAGQPFAESFVVFPGDRGFLAAVLEPGARAVSVPVNATTGISGFIFPGDKVDVLLTVALQSEANGQKQTRYLSETVLQEIRVLAIDQAAQNVEGKAELAKTATLEVTPKQAETIAIALQMGALSLSLNSLGYVGVTPEADDVENGVRVASADGSLPAINLTAAQENTEPSYTIDLDVLNARKDPRLRLGGGGSGRKAEAAPKIVVLRADQSENVAF